MKFYPTSNMFDDMFENFFGPTYSGSGLMRTDIHEKDGKYIMDIDLPGYQKEDNKISLYNGSLTIQAEHHESNEEKDAKGNLLRQERYTGACSRSFYVGDHLKQEDIHASFKDGILTLSMPTEKKKEEETKKFIDIL